MIKRTFIIFMVFLLGIVLNPQTNEEDKYQSEINSELVSALNEARSIRRNRDYKEAIRLLHEIVKKEPNYYLANYNLALVLAQNGQFNESVKYFKISVKIKEKNKIRDSSVYNSTGWVYMQKGDYYNAEKYFIEAIKNEYEMSAKSKMKTYNNIGLLNIYKADYRTSEIYLKKAIDLGSKLAEENLNILNKLKQKKKK